MPSPKNIKDNIGWNFDNTYIKMPERFYTKMAPIAVSQPRVVIINYPLAKELGLQLQQVNEEQLAQLFSGNILPPGASPIALAYAGHQFGYFTYLGDGRAHLLGEQITPNKRRFDIQFKGSGQTPYGRRGDGRAALGPMLREYLISEAMHALHIPTTRSLAVVTTGEQIYRETMLKGAILTRVSSSHMRVGTFQYLSAEQDMEGLKQLADYLIDRHYPEVKQDEHPYLKLLNEVIAKQVDLIVNWMRVGFIHGVMNTDNMALSGETIDYGPCAFMDEYDPATVFSSIDSMGRYSYANQPLIAQWNLARFAETLLPLLDTDLDKALQLGESAINEFSTKYSIKWLGMMRAKLGLFGENEEDLRLVSDLLQWMHQQRADYTNTFLDLAQVTKPANGLYGSTIFNTWYERWQQRLKQNNQSIESSLKLMNATNPAIIPRNHHVAKCLESAEQDDVQPFLNLLKALKEPYNNRSDISEYQSPPKPNERVFQTFCGT